MIVTLSLGLSNAFLLEGSRPILIDTGRPRDALALRAAVAARGFPLHEISLILHTHGHWDHCGSTAQLEQWTHAPTAIHAGDADKMMAGTNGILRPAGVAGWLLRPVLDRRYPGCRPDIVFDGDFDLAPFGVRARAIPTPGHTAGSISVLTEDGDAIVGDTIMGGFLAGKLLPHVPKLHYFAEDLDLLRHSVSQILRLKPRMIYTGHGGPLQPGAVAASPAFLSGADAPPASPLLAPSPARKLVE